MKPRYEDDILPPPDRPGWGRVLILVALLGLIGTMVCLALSGCASRGTGVTKTTTVQGSDGTVTTTVEMPVADPFDAALADAARALFDLTEGRARP